MRMLGAQRLWALMTPPLLLVLLLVSPAGARQVTSGRGPVFRGTVVAEDSETPLATGSVSLHLPDGSKLLTAFTNEAGTYTVQAPSPGVYRLRAERIGYEPQELGPFSVQTSDTITVNFSLAPAPLLQDSILVSVRRQGRALGAGEQLIYGRLLEWESEEPIPQGTVQLLTARGSAAATTLSDDDGIFWLVSPQAGTYSLQAERIGYKTSVGPEFRLMLGDTLGVDFFLSTEAVVLDPMLITATKRPIWDRYDLSGMAGFLRRYSQYSRSGFGDFMIRDSIADYEGRATSTGHMMAMNLMSVREVLTDGARYGQVILRGITPPTGFGAPGVCVPTYYMDGVQFPPQAVATGQVNPVAMYPPELLEGVEVYVRPNIPPEYMRGDWPCGVVAFWTRRDPGASTSAIPGWKKGLAAFLLLASSLLLSR